VPDNEPHQEPSLEQRRAIATGDTDDGARFDNWGGDRVPAVTRIMHGVWAGEYVRLLSEGDTGAAFSHLHHLRHHEPDVDPWRLLEHAVTRALAGTPSRGGAEAPGSGETDEPLGSPHSPAMQAS
jgi:hypothetical protein